MLAELARLALAATSFAVPFATIAAAADTSFREVALIYGAASLRPLTFGSTTALFVCVGVCVLGVGLGVALKVRSYVYLGTTFLVTAVLAGILCTRSTLTDLLQLSSVR